jgi:hypothetical protein
MSVDMSAIILGDMLLLAHAQLNETLLQGKYIISCSVFLNAALLQLCNSAATKLKVNSRSRTHAEGCFSVTHVSGLHCSNGALRITMLQSKPNTYIILATNAKRKRNGRTDLIGAGNYKIYSFALQ